MAFVNKFAFAPAQWLLKQDKEVLERCRNIHRREMEITNENGHSSMALFVWRCLHPFTN